MAITDIQDFFFSLERWGLTDALLPFLLIFSILFAILQKTKLFGQDRKNINVTVAISIALLVVVPHITNDYPPNFDVVDIINRALPATTLVIVAVIMFLILIGLFGADLERTGFPLGGAVFFIALGVIIFIFGASAGWWFSGTGYWVSNYFGDDALSIVILILVFGIIIAFITGGEQKEGARLKDDFKKLFGGE